MIVDINVQKRKLLPINLYLAKTNPPRLDVNTILIVERTAMIVLLRINLPKGALVKTVMKLSSVGCAGMRCGFRERTS